MSTDDENDRTDDAEDSPTVTPRDGRNDEGASEGGENVPRIRDHTGPWDEAVNRIVLLILPVGVVAATASLALSGAVRFDYAVTGDVPAETVFNRLVVPAAYTVGGALLILYALALMKFYGSNPFAWVVEKIRNAARDYNPEE